MHRAEVRYMTGLLEVSDLVSIFDAALMWFDKDPRQSFSNYGLHGWIIPLTRDREVRDLVHDLLLEIEGGRMRTVRSGQLQGIPQSWKQTLGDLPGNRDPRHTMVTAQALAKFAAERGEKPEFLAHLIDEKAPSVSADRPTPPEPRPAPDAKINEAIAAVYDEAEVAKEKPPNMKEGADVASVPPRGSGATRAETQGNAKTKRKPGPAPGSIARFKKPDEAVSREMKKLMRKKNLSATEAARELGDKIPGRGTLDSRVRRVVERFNRHNK
jgi:hypothetical protein